MKRSCLECKYSYISENFADFIKKSGSKYCSLTCLEYPFKKEKHPLCRNPENSPIDYSNNIQEYSRCSEFNESGYCPKFEKEEAENIIPIKATVTPDTHTATVGATLKLEVKLETPKPLDPPVPAQLLSFKYQWYRNGRKLFKEKGSSIVVDTEKAGVFIFYCEITENLSDNGDGGKKEAKVKTNLVSVIVEGDGAVI